MRPTTEPCLIESGPAQVEELPPDQIQRDGTLVETVTQPPARATIDGLISAGTAARIARAIPQNTTVAYANDLGAFHRWCQRTGRTPLPATAETAAEYAAYLADGGAIRPDGTRKGPAAPATINRALSAIRTHHRRNGFKGQPDLDAARLIINGHRKDLADEGISEKRAAALTVEQLRAIVDACPDTLAGTRDRALIVLGFALMARRSELAALNGRDLNEKPEGVEVLIRYSKTDQEAIGELVPVHYGAHLGTCPVRLLRSWRAELADRGIPSGGPLWWPIDRKDRLAGTPGYAGKSQGRLLPKAVGLILREAAVRAGVDPVGVSAHSLRASGATEAYRAGNSLLAISRRGRWKDGSPVLLRYIRTVDKWKDNPMAGVL